jgi:large subunit ribosomal protein L25
MITLNAKKRETKTSGDINRLRLDKFIPGILYGGSEENKKISLSKNLIKNLINLENFFSAILNLEIDGKKKKLYQEIFHLILCPMNLFILIL